MNKDLLTTIKQINEKQKTSLYILCIQDTIIATSYKADMDKFLISDEHAVSVYDDNITDVVLMHGLVLDNSVLPFDISPELMKGRQLWLFVDGFDGSVIMDPYPSIVTIVKAIEGYLKNDEDLEISDFAVLLGEEITLGLSVPKAGTHIQVSKLY